MIVKLVKAVARADGFLMVDGGGDTIADAYLSKGWTILGIVPGAARDEVGFVLQQDQITAAAEILEEAAIIDTAELREAS
jgi:hypothetical protein